jgi:hypothetical protein
LAGQSRFKERVTGDKAGASLSVTVTVKEQRSPDAVVTITLLDPIWKKEPEAGVNFGAGQLPETPTAGKFI